METLNLLLSSSTTKEFSESVLNWYHIHGRKDLPWQNHTEATSAYPVWISEIMLQQTQVATVIPYYHRFMQSFPTLKALAKSSQEKVLHLWSGLGYYARARNLHKTAQMIQDEHQGKFPEELDQLIALPGIGRSTAGAIRSLGMNQRGVILDGNVKRVIARYFGIEGWTGQTAVLRNLWQIVEQLTPTAAYQAYNQGMMDLGATCCTRSRPDCQNCPLQQGCYARNNHATHILPSPKKNKPKKQLERHFLILVNPKRQVLLIKRPNFGLWGGLWVFPEFETQAELKQYCKKNINKVSYSSTLASFNHILTHIQLKVTPHLTQGELVSHHLNETKHSHFWYDIIHPSQIGLNAMVSIVLNSIKKKLKSTSKEVEQVEEVEEVEYT